MLSNKTQFSVQFNYPPPNCLKTNSCSQDQLVSYIYTLNLEKINEIQNSTTIWIVITLLGIVLSCIPIKDLIYDKYKKK